MVAVRALEPFVTILGEEMISAVRDDEVVVPKARAEQLVAAGLASLVDVKAAPENKKAEGSPEVKAAPRKRAAAKAAPAAE